MEEKIEMEIDYPEWLPAAADMEWDEQKKFFEDYAAKLQEEHKRRDLIVMPKQQAIIDRVKTMTDALQGQEPKPKEIVHFMSFDPHGSKGPGVYCSCGMHKIHKRGKVLAAWADKHFEKYGHYWKRT